MACCHRLTSHTRFFKKSSNLISYPNSFSRFTVIYILFDLGDENPNKGSQHTSSKWLYLLCIHIQQDNVRISTLVPWVPVFAWGCNPQKNLEKLPVTPGIASIWWLDGFFRLWIIIWSELTWILSMQTPSLESTRQHVEVEVYRKYSQLAMQYSSRLQGIQWIGNPTAILPILQIPHECRISRGSFF